MTRKEKVRYDMFVRVRQFGNEHHQQFPASSTGGQLFAAVAAAAARIETRATAKLLASQEGTESRAADRKAILKQMKAIVRTARAVGRHVPGAERVFRLPERGSDIALLTAARAFIHEGQAAKARLVTLGLPDTFVTDLQQVVDRFDKSRDGRQASKNSLRTSQSELRESIAQGFAAVRQLDAVVPNALGDDAVLLDLWAHIRRVEPSDGTTATIVTPAVAADVLAAVAPVTAVAPSETTPVADTNDAAIVVAAQDAFKKAS